MKKTDKLLALSVPTERLHAFRERCRALHVTQTGVINDFLVQWLAAACPDALVIPSRIGKPLLDLRRALLSDASNGDCLGAITPPKEKPGRIPANDWERRLAAGAPGVTARTAGR